MKVGKGKPKPEKPQNKGGRFRKEFPAFHFYQTFFLLKQPNEIAMDTKVRTNRK